MVEEALGITHIVLVWNKLLEIVLVLELIQTHHLKWMDVI